MSKQSLIKEVFFQLLTYAPNGREANLRSHLIDREFDAWRKSVLFNQILVAEHMKALTMIDMCNRQVPYWKKLIDVSIMTPKEVINIRQSKWSLMLMVPSQQ